MSIAADWSYPVDTMVHELVPICTGLDLLTVVPSPSPPRLPYPHAHNVPSLRIANDVKPNDIDVQVAGAVTKPLTDIFTGFAALIVVPVPNCPEELRPHAHKPPVVSIARL